MTKTNYLGIHENHYRYSKENNKPGWNDSETIKNILEFILNTFEKYDLDKSIKILELGCGDGELALSLAELGYNVSGVDISPTAIEWAKEKAKERNLNVDLFTGDVLNMEFKDNSFDLAIDSYCLHCIIGEDRAKFLKEIKRILKPEGVLTGITMSNTIPDDIKPMFNERREMVKNGIAGRYIGRSDDILNEFEEVGFKIMDHSVTKIENEADDLKYVLKIRK